MKLIFLDIDGVLNHQLWFNAQSITNRFNVAEYHSSMLDPARVEILNYIIFKTNAKVVVSSSWRKTHTKEKLQSLLEGRGFKGEIIGTTPCLSFSGVLGYNYSVPRGNEIKAWLELNKGILNNKLSKVPYVILDDDSDMLLWQRNNYHWVDPYCGLTPSIANKVIKFLQTFK